MSKHILIAHDEGAVLRVEGSQFAGPPQERTPIPTCTSWLRRHRIRPVRIFYKASKHDGLWFFKVSYLGKIVDHIVVLVTDMLWYTLWEHTHSDAYEVATCVYQLTLPGVPLIGGVLGILEPRQSGVSVR